MFGELRYMRHTRRLAGNCGGQVAQVGWAARWEGVRGVLSWEGAGAQQHRTIVTVLAKLAKVSVMGPPLSAPGGLKSGHVSQKAYKSDLATDVSEKERGCAESPREPLPC